MRTTSAHRRGAEHAEVNTSCAKAKLLTTLVSGFAHARAAAVPFGPPSTAIAPASSLISYGADFRDHAPPHLVASSHTRPPDVFPCG